MKKVIAYIAVVFILASCAKDEPTLFTYLNAKESGVSFSNHIKNTPELNILNYLYFYNGAGVAAADFNDDDLPDLYFTSNVGEDKLYLNTGNLQFKDVTINAGVSNTYGFTTGVTVVDINNDGKLDIYICKVADLLDEGTHNLLFVNQGVIDGIVNFKEQSEAYGLNIASYATQASFFDYDLDGDLDLFLLNHSVKPNRSYGKGNKRNEVDLRFGDKLYENIDSTYVDITAKAKIFQGGIGYGLGVSISDLNSDGYPDIYVGNDFFENDYLYINQKDKTFKEVISTNSAQLGHTSHFSMGNVIGDIDNDGLQDIFSVDMLPEDLFTLKTSAPEYNYPININYLRQGYSPQYMQNTLHLNRGNGIFSEIAHLSGLEATEWSWSPLIADLDNDGSKDIYITNGILGATNDLDFINFISDEAIQKSIDQGVREDEMKLISKIPVKKTFNYIYKNKDGLKFIDKSDEWIQQEVTFSNGAAASDLDNDGDLDIVVNNVNDVAHIIINHSNSTQTSNNYIKIHFNGQSNNVFGIGTKVFVYTDSLVQTAENFTTKGYLSASEPVLHFGLTNKNIIDSLEVIWPDQTRQILYEVSANQNLRLNHSEAKRPETIVSDSVIKELSEPKIMFKHKENTTLDFNRDALIPYANSSFGPALAVADINNDGLEDVFIGGAKAQASSIFTQKDNGEFVSYQENLFKESEINEDISAVFEDLNGDSFPELIVASAGNEFSSGKPIQPRLYWNDNGKFWQDSTAFNGIYANASKLKLVDIDRDQDKDIVLLSNTIPNQFGKTPQQYIMLNDGSGHFENVTSTFAPEFQYLGNLTDIVFGDFNGNNKLDFITVGHWSPLTLFELENNQYVRRNIEQFKSTNGWWNTIIAEDFDNDGDLDLVVGNWGENTRLKASINEPITLYTYDFDNSGVLNPIATYFYQGQETTFASKEELDKQMPFIKKKYLTHNAFAKASIDEIFGKLNLSEAEKKNVFTLSSTYFENLGNFNFKAVNLPFMAQISSVNNIVVDDFNTDGYFDILLTGNHYEISTQLSRLDASHGELFLNDTNGSFYYHPTPELDISGFVRNTCYITIANKKYLLVGRNNDTPLLVPLQLIKN